MVQRLVDANFGFHFDQFGRAFISKFLTLTFRDDIRTPEQANPYFTLFMKRLNYRLFGSKISLIKYLVIIEFMPISKRLHYHAILFNLPYIDNFQNVFEEVWDHGFIWIEKVPDVGIGHYISKYMTKADDERLRERKSYFCSRGLIMPLLIRDENVLWKVMRILPDDARKYANAYETEHTGLTQYRRYSLHDYPDILKSILANIKESVTFKTKP
jgi:hypothetical protein